jgi:tetratricopeptide (TPR) repeat protein
MTRAAAAFLATLLASQARAEALDDQDGEARRHYEIATRAMNAGEFDLAIDEYKHAYQISPAPGLLFNLAQAYRAKRDRERALYFYGAYVREAPDGAERGFAEARMAELRVAAFAPQETQDESGSGLRTAGAWTLGGGLVLIAGGLFSSIEALTALDDDSRGAAHSAQVRAVWLTAAGAVAVATGGILLHVGGRRSVAVGAGAAPGGASLRVAVTF